MHVNRLCEVQVIRSCRMQVTRSCKMQVTLAATCIFMRRPFSSIYVILKKGLEVMNKFIKESDNVSR